ncbi:sigma factor-like helix-turn-helix DNA-binding protein [Nonomuraea wenchangensis]|uniref:sigma factor-like helix-turn-helix DNA-binding protein n=1 Tax=Nonomuraea wenchangensis TaxID=568860 RepID=UPI003327303C
MAAARAPGRGHDRQRGRLAYHGGGPSVHRRAALTHGRPEASYEDRLPKLIVTEDGGAPEDDALLAESVGLALLVVLNTLRPAERLAFVLHDMFAVPFEEIGQIIGRSTDAAKMLASRARRKVQATPRPTDERQAAARSGRCVHLRSAERRLRGALAGARPGRDLAHPHRSRRPV